MVRKMSAIILALIVTISCFATTGLCASYSVYSNGSISSTYITYFKDIISGQSINSDYVAFRSSQYEYILAVGNIDYDGTFKGNGAIKIYTFDTESSNYNQNLRYTISSDSNFSLSRGETVVYSNLGDYPQLIERGSHYEVITAVLVGVCMCSVVIGRIFFYRKS